MGDPNYWVGLIFEGLGWTVLLAIVGTAVGFVLSLLLVLLRTQKIDKRRDNLFVQLGKRIGNYFAIGYITVFRGTPMMVQAMLVFFGIKMLVGNSIPGFNALFSAELAGIIVISLNTAAYIAEVIRGAVNSIDVGQMEAGRTLGFSRIKTMFLIIYPQAIKNSIPAIGNEFIVNLKDSSVLSVIGIIELFKAGSLIFAKTFDYITVYTIVAGIYLVLTVICSIVVNYLEKRLGRTINSRRRLRKKNA